MLEELPKGWVWTRLEDIADIILGQSPPSSAYNENGDGLPFYQGKLEFGKIYPTPRKWCTAPKKIAEKGDVLISVRAPVGPTNICPETSCIGRGLAAIRGLEGIETLFILYLMRSFENVTAGKGTGTTFKAITSNQLRDLEIPLPPLAEQHRIVAKIEELFTKLDAGVESLKKAKAQLKCYRQSVLKAAVEGKLTEEWREAHKGELEPASVLLERILRERREKWEAEQLVQMKTKGKMPKDDSWKKKYKEPSAPENSGFTEPPEGWSLVSGDIVFWFITSGSRGWAKYYDDSGPLFLRMGNLDHDSINLNLKKVQRVKPPIGAEGTRTRVISGDILISITADVGMIALIPDNIEDAYINQHVALARLVSSVNQSYIAWFLASREGGQKQFLALQRGATKMGLGLDDIRAVNIPLPPLVEQNKIIEELERRLSIVEKVETIIEANFKGAERLRQSILNQAFLGRLVPQNPNDEPASVLLERIKEEKVKRELEAKNKKKSKVISRSKNVKKVKKCNGGEKPTVDLYDILQSSKEPLKPKELWLSSELDDIEYFYTQLKKEVEEGRIIELRPNDTDVFLELRI